jgi:exonuclease-1
MGFKVEESPVDVDDSGIVLESPPGLSATEFRSDVVEADEGILSDDEWLAKEREPARFARALSELPVQGSEDMIVPESPEEVPAESSARQQLNLSRFAFGA